VRASARISIAAPTEAVWTVVSDPEQMLSFMTGVTRWEVESDEPTGLGARYRMLMRVGSAEIGGLIEIVEWEPPRELAWTSITGIDQKGRWRLRPAPGGRTSAEIRLAYGVAGAGLAGWVAEKIAAPAVTSNLRSSCRQLARLIDHEQTRQRVAARRAGAAGTG
jgi:uncharacterized membrane protein